MFECVLIDPTIGMNKLGRNDPCPCGSDKKYKQCCGAVCGGKPAARHGLPIHELLQRGLDHHRAGRLSQAEAAYREILQTAPDHPDALYLLGMAASSRGQNELAADLIGRAVEINPAAPTYYNLGNVFLEMGRLEAAADCFRKTLKLKQDYVNARLNLGAVLKEQGKLEEAAESFHEAIRLKPDLHGAYLHLGNVFKDQDRLEEATVSFRKALALKPDYAEAHNNLGNVLKAQGKLDEAIESYAKALALKPDYVEAGVNLGRTFKEKGNLDAAVACYREALKFRPDLVEGHSNLGCALHEQGDYDGAGESFRKAIALKPDDILALTGMEMLLRDMGRFDAAKTYIDRVLAIEPDRKVEWASLAGLRKMTPDDRLWMEKAQRLLEDAPKPDEETILCFALGKYHDDIRQYETAFAYYDRANRLRKQQSKPFDREQMRNHVDKIISAYPLEAVRQQYPGASNSRRPLFIVGMPRSGTSLTEQILASHPEVFGAGELRFWGQQANRHSPAMLHGCGGEGALQDIAIRYEAELQRHSAIARRVVDKMPGNFFYLGLIHAVFPQARILHTMRNPADTCLSIYFQDIPEQHTYASDLDDLAFYYREYHRLMAHWRTVLPPEVFIDVPYESLVDDQEGWSRRIIEFNGLEWDERCLNFQETERNVGTASNWQVRQRIYKTSKERWRNYEKFLTPLLDALGELAPAR